MAANYVLLEKITVGAAGASSVTFSGIPQTGYTDLKVVLSGRNDQSGIAAVNIAFNGSTANLSYRSIFGDGSSAASYSGTNPQIQYLPGTSQTANTFNNAEMYIPNYAGSTNKSFSVDQVQETNATTAYIVPFSGLWSQTAAITSITFSLLTGNFVANSTFYLYGVAKLGTTPVIVPYATGGDTIMTDGTGAGGYQIVSQGVTTTNYSVTIGAGGSAPASFRGNSGSNSSFASLITSTGGGGGGANAGGFETGGNGGSGGGACGSGTGIAGGTGISGQGFAGGSTTSGAPYYGAAGGGGAGAVGGNGTSSGGANGGAGSNSASSWASATLTGVSGYYAGGGGGGMFGGGPIGAGGLGGGGNATVSGVANTGGGGGGATNNTTNAGNGGSGIVIIRYPIAS